MPFILQKLRNSELVNDDPLSDTMELVVNMVRRASIVTAEDEDGRWHHESFNPFGVGINYDKEKLPLKWTSMVDVQSGPWF